MNFDQYKHDVGEALDKWLGALQNGTKSASDDLKEAAGDLIAGWKESFPRRKADIERFVDEKMVTFFKENE